jgi:hypothetical protein
MALWDLKQKALSLFALVTLFSFSSVALANDTDGDGVLDIQDAYPNDASRQYLPIAEAISKIADQNLRACLEDQTRNFEHAGELKQTGCPGWNGVRSLEGLQNFTELEDLFMDGPEYSDLSPLANLIDLESIQVQYPQTDVRIKDISSLAKLTKLKRLGINGSNVADFSVLVSFPLLETLELGGTRLSTLAELGQLKNLRSLNVNRTLVREMPSEWSQFPALESLSINNLQLSNIDSVFTIQKIKEVYAERNNLQSVTLSEGLTALDYLGLDGNHELREIINFALTRMSYLGLGSTGLASLDIWR